MSETIPKPPFKVRAIYDYKSDHDDDLTFVAGQIIQVTDIEDDDWYTGNYDGNSGMFPKNFVKIEDPPKKLKREVPQPPKSVEPEKGEETKPDLRYKPVFPTKRVEDPYVVKKPFMASAKSSYVPPIKPRDDSFLIGGHGQNQTLPTNTEIVKSSTKIEHDDFEETNLSLKERISLLQKRQQEEAEREAAALQRQELRKQKAAEKKEKLKNKREQDQNDDLEYGDENHGGRAVNTTHTGESVKSNLSSKSPLDNLDNSEDLSEHVQEQPTRNDPQSEDEESQEEDEELKRRKLVERMAKISGGRNMFGMMGMPPFGAPLNTSKNTKNDVSPENSVEKAKDANDDIDTALKVEESDDYESPSLREDDKPVEYLDHEVSSPTIISNNIDNSSETELVDETVEKLLINKEKSENKLDPEITGYEADEDISDRNKIESSDEFTPVLTSAKINNSMELSISIPPILPVPIIPPIPPTSSRTKAPPPPPPSSIPDIPAVPVTREVPPIPSTVPISPTLLREEFKVNDSVINDESDKTTEGVSDEESGDFDFEQPNRSYTLPPDLPPPIPAIPTPSALPPVPITRASTDIPPLATSHTGNSVSSQFRRTSTDILRKSETIAESHYEALNHELSDVSNIANWWLKDQLPEFLGTKINIELIYEVDTNQIKKRGGVTKVYKDYYILFYDLSQLVFEIEYELVDPRSTVKVTYYGSRPIPILRKDLLNKYHREYGGEILRIAQLATHELFIQHLFKSLPSRVLPPIGSKSFGVNVYKNVNNHQIVKVDDIRKGDIICIKNGKFQVHKGLGSKTTTVGEQDIYSAIITEYDPKKEKFTVIDQGKTNTYKMSEMKSGQVRVFRIVSRDYVDW